MRYEKTLLPKKNFDYLMLGISISSIFFTLFYIVILYFLTQKRVLTHPNIILFFNTSVIQLAILSGIIFSGMLILTPKIKKSFLARLGFINFKTKLLFLPLLYFVITILILAQLKTLTEQIFKYFNWPVKEQMLNEIILNADLMGTIVLGLCVIILAPIFEEILFRRAIFSTILPISNIFIATIITSLLFALVHFDSFINMPVLFGLAVILQFIYIKHRSIYPVIFLHSINNTFAFIMVLLVKYQVISEEFFKTV